MERDEVVTRLAAAYVATQNVAAVVLAGSVGRGRADRFSDVELDVYWERAPSDDQRLTPTAALGGTVTTLWPYDDADAEWSEDVEVAGTDVTVSGFARTEMERWIDSLAQATDPQLVRQLRFSALQEGRIMYGEELVERWRASSAYPRALAIATASSYLSPDRLTRWRLWPALLDRGDLVMLHRACADVVDGILGALCALNGIYLEHPSFKWSRHLVRRFERAPDGFSQRLFGALDAGVVECAPRLHQLLVETVGLVRVELPDVDVSGLQGVLAGSRSS